MAEHLIHTPEQLATCCQTLAQLDRLGLDTEFVGEESYHPDLCLLQVAAGDDLFLIDPLSVGPLDAFWKLIVDPARQIVVHAGREEVRLCHLWSGQTPGNLFDLQIAAGLAGLAYPLGHGNLVYQVLGVQLAKGETLTEWRTRPLTKAQIRYALDDVRYLLPVCQVLENKLEELGRRQWAREEFARLTEAATPEEPGEDTERWRRLKGAGTLDRRRLAMLRELFLWRDRAAAKANRPPRTVVRDDLLLEIVRRNPTNEHDLHVVRGLAKRYAGDILVAVQRARAVPPEELPPPVDREQDPPQVAQIVNVLNAYLADFGARRQLAPNLVAANQDLKLLVRARMQGRQVPEGNLLTRGWRAEHILPDLLAILAGKRTLRIRDVASDTPFTFSDVGQAFQPDAS